MSPSGHRRRAQGILLALLSATGFSTLGLFAKLIYGEGFSVPQALAWRFTVAAAFLWSMVGLASVSPGASATVLARIMPPRPPLGNKLGVVVLLGVLGFAPQAGMYFLTVSILDPGISGLLLYLYPSFVILISLVFLRRKPNGIQALSLALSLTGCAITFFRPGNYPLVGLALGVFMAVFYASYLVVADRVLVGVDPIRATAVMMSGAALVYWTVAVATGTVKAPTGIAIAGILGVGVFATVLPITTLFAAMKRIGASDTSLVSTLEPVLTIALSALIIGERLASAQAIGGALILAAVVVLRFEPPSTARPEANTKMA